MTGSKILTHLGTFITVLSEYMNLFQPMTRPLPLVSANQMQGEGPYSVWYNFYNSH